MPKALIILLVVLLIIFILWLIYRGNFKKITIQCVNLITGNPKTGKSLLSVELAPRQYKKVHRAWWFKTHILKEKCEEPLFYTNSIFSFRNCKNRDNVKGCKRKPHKLDKNIRYLDIDILRRAKRIPYKSVVYIQEASLTADQQEYLDRVLNCEQSLFNKLFGHESKGGYLFYDTQNVADCHYAIKRCCGSYLWILKSKNFFFFRVLYIREMINTDNVSGAQNNVNDDIEYDGIRKYIVWRNVYKRYDRYYFSYLTDNLPISDTKFDFKEKKKEIVSFSPLYRDAGLCMSEDELRKRDNERIMQRNLQEYENKLRIKEERKELNKNG